MTLKVKEIKPEFVDKRGFIARIIDKTKLEIRSVLLITSKANTQRANHYHKKDSHYVYCLSGKFKYSEKDVRHSRSKEKSIIVKSGDLILTPPMHWHSMYFLEDTEFLAFTTETRNQKKYELDTIRL